MLTRYIAGGVGGFILAATSLVHVAVVGDNTPDPALAALSFFGWLIAGFVVAVTSPSASKAWRRLFFVSAALWFLLPLSGVIMIAMLSRNPAVHPSATAGAFYIVMTLAMVGALPGAACWGIGKLIGRDKNS